MKKMQAMQRRIEAAVNRARALGMSLVAQGAWGVDYTKKAGWVPDKLSPEVCICGAIALAENPTDDKGILRAIAKKYRITWAQAASLSDGFEEYTSGNAGADDYPPRNYRRDQAWYRIGRKWRERADRVESRW